MPKKLRPAGDLLAFKCHTLKVNQIKRNCEPVVENAVVMTAVLHVECLDFLYHVDCSFPSVLHAFQHSSPGLPTDLCNLHNHRTKLRTVRSQVFLAMKISPYRV